MYFSDRITLPIHSLIGGGILGMTVIYFLCWPGIKLAGLKHE